MATRTAPTYDGTTPTSRLFSFKLIDASGDTISISFQVDAAATAANIEAFAAAYQLATQASLYEIVETSNYTGAMSKANADSDQHNSVADGVNLAFKNLSTRQLAPIRVVAPTLSVVPAGADVPDLGGQLNPVITGYPLILANFPFQTAQFTERKESKNNPKVIG